MRTDSVGIRQLKPWANPAGMSFQAIGYQVDWERTSDYFAGGNFPVKLNGAVAIGADEITVDALTRPLFAGDILKAPDVATVVVTLNGAVTAADVSMTVDALSGPIPAGTLLYFGQASETVRVTTAAAAGATTLAIDPAPTGIEDNDTATYQGGEHNLEVLEDAAVGATTVAVGNVQFAIADDTNLYAQRHGFNPSDKFIPEGTVMALDATSKKMFPRRDGASDDSEEAIGFIASDASNSPLSHFESRSGYGLVNGNVEVYENLLPDADTSGNISSTWKTELAANTFGVQYRDYEDKRAA